MDVIHEHHLFGHISFSLISFSASDGKDVIDREFEVSDQFLQVLGGGVSFKITEIFKKICYRIVHPS